MVKRNGITKIKVLIAIGLLSIMAGCEEEKTNLIYELNEPDDLTIEVYEIYSRIINSHFSNHEYIVIQQETDSVVHPKYCYSLYESDTTDLDSTTIRNYLNNNEECLNLGYDLFRTDVNVKLITREERKSYEGMDSYTANYPEAKGLIYVTLPGFNNDSTKALLEYTWQTGDDEFQRYLVYLNHRQKKWHIKVHENISGS